MTVFFLILIALLLLLGLWIGSSRAAYAREAERRRHLNLERQRVEACGEVVLFFANHLGYIARSTISRQELAELIDAGITAPELASEIARRIEQTEGLILGYHPLGEAQIEVKLAEEHRQRHLYIVGKSGSGKTNLLRNLIFQDLAEGAGLGVVAPEAEMLTEELLPYIPDHRLEDVIYFDPADSQCPVSFNPLALDPGEDLDTKVDENLTIFQRVVGATGPRMEEILRQALYTLTGRPGATLLDIERLLDRSDSGFRNEVIRSADEAVAHFWRDIYPSFPKDAHLPITNRLGRFIRPAPVRRILCHGGASLNFREAMDQGRIMLFNLSDGILGEQTSQLLGQLVVSKFQLATMSRATQPKAARRQFYLYLDEFQTFVGTAASSYERLLQRARKYRLGLVLAHQQTGQLPAELLKEIMGNVSTSICFLVSREDAQKFSKELVTLYDGAVVNIPAEEILRLKVGEAWCKIGQHAFLMRTYLADQHPDHERARWIIEQARRNYALPEALEGKVAAPLPEAAAPLPPPPVKTPVRQEVKPPRVQAEEALRDLEPGNLFGEEA